MANQTFTFERHSFVVLRGGRPDSLARRRPSPRPDARRKLASI